MEQQFLTYIETHQGLLYKVCRAYGADREAQRDLYQEIVLQLWRAFPRFDGRVLWSTWAYRIALNVAITQRRRRRVPTLELSERPDTAMPDPAGAHESLEVLYRAIAQLNDAEKALILLHLDDLPYSEIAEITGLTENHVGVKLSRIKSKLKTLIRT